MKRGHRLIVGTLGLAACGLAHAQAVEVYGTLFQFAEMAKTSGATSQPPADRPTQVSPAAYTGVNDASRSRLSAGTSNWGFRGSEDLGNGLKVIWQLESAFQIDGGPGPGFAARNSHVALQGKFGTVSLGQWDTPYKFISLVVNPIRVGYQADQTPIIGNPSFGVPPTTTQFTRAPGKPDAAFDRRQGNAIQYWSPAVGGFSARLMLSVNEGKTTATATAPEISPTLFSGSVMYNVGGLSLRYAYEQHDDYFGMTQLGGSAADTVTNGGSRDRGHKFVANWRAGPALRIAGIFERLEYRNSDSAAGAVSNYERDAYYAIGEFFFGNQSVWASYGRADDGSCSRVGGLSCTTNGLAADYVAAGWVYNFSKRTQLIATYYKVGNKTSGTYNVLPSIGPTLAPGADPTGVGLGIVHTF